MPTDPNPYASPADVARDDRPPSTGEAVLLRAGLLFRRVWLPPPVGAILEYTGRTLGYDAVSIAGRRVAWRWSWLWFVPRFDFQAPSDHGPLPGVLLVEIDPWLRVRRMRIEVNDAVVYEETTAG